MVRNEFPVELETSEIKSITSAEVIDHQAIIELKNKKSRLEFRKECLCTGIARDIRFAGVESISDWMNRVSKDIDSWRIDLNSLESEIASVDAELTMFGKLGELKRQLESINTAEAELMENLCMVHIERAQIRSKIHELTHNMNSHVPKGGSSDVFVAADEKSMNSLVTDSHILHWDHYSDSGFLHCNLCNTQFNVHGFHTCAIPNKPGSGYVICPDRVPELSHQSTDYFAQCQINDRFDTDGQIHYCTREPVMSQTSSEPVTLQTSSEPVTLQTSSESVETSD